MNPPSPQTLHRRRRHRHRICQQLVHRTRIGDLQQTHPLFRIQVSTQCNLTPNRECLVVNLDAHVDRLQVPALALGVHAQRHRRAASQRAGEHFHRRRPQILAADRRRLIRDQRVIPNRNVDVAFRTTTVVTNEGKAYSGLLKELEGNRISIVDSQAKETILQTNIIEERQASANSPMPSNVGETLNELQLRDLVSFLLLQKKIVEGTKP